MPLPPPPPYPLLQAANSQSRLEEAMAQQTRFEEAARNMPARVLDFQGATSRSARLPYMPACPPEAAAYPPYQVA